MELFGEDRFALLLKLIQRKPHASIQYLADKIGVSTRTIRNDIKQINDELQTVAYIESAQGVCRLYITEEEEFEKKMSKLCEMDEFLNSPQGRSAFIVQKLMRSEEPYLIDDLAFGMNIGRTTLNGDLKKTKEMLRPYGIKIEGKTNSGLELRGNEFNLRLFLIENMYEAIYGKYPMDQEVLDLAKDVLNRYYFEKHTEESFMRSLTVMLDRLMTGHPLKGLDSKYYEIENNPAFKIGCSVALAIESELHIEIPCDERIFITLPIVGMRTPTDVSNLCPEEITKDTKEIIKNIIEKIVDELNLEIDCEGFLDDFAYHINFMINRLLFGIRLKNQISSEIREKYPLAYKMAKIAGGIIEERYQITVPEDELGYLTAYFGVFILESDIRSHKVYKVAIVCATGRGTARLIGAQLKKILDKRTVLDLYADTQLDSNVLSDYDLVFSTFRLPFKTEVPVIIIHEIFDEKEILRQIETIKYLNKLDIPLLPGNHSLLAGILDENSFFVLNRHKTYMENTVDMIKSLFEKGYVDEGFSKRVMEREKKSTMVFGRDIAFPHAINIGSDRLMLAVGVFPEPIVEGDREIRLVFLLGLPESEENDETLLVKIYDEIIAIAQKEEIVEEISQIKDYKQMVRYFMKIDSLFA